MTELKTLTELLFWKGKGSKLVFGKVRAEWKSRLL